MERFGADSTSGGLDIAPEIDVSGEMGETPHRWTG
jgi:hypothetical protein